MKKLKLHTFFNPYRAWMVFNISQWWIGRSFAVSSQPRSRFKWIRPPDLLLATLWGLSCFLGGWVISEEVQSSLCSSTAESEYEHQMWWLRKVSSEYDCCFVTVHRGVLRGVRTVVTHHRFHFCLRWHRSSFDCKKRIGDDVNVFHHHLCFNSLIYSSRKGLLHNVLCSCAHYMWGGQLWAREFRILSNLFKYSLRLTHFLQRPWASIWERYKNNG